MKLGKINILPPKGKGIFSLIIAVNVFLLGLAAYLFFTLPNLTVKVPAEFSDKGRVIISRQADSIAGARIGKRGVTKFKLEKGKYQISIYLDSSPGAGQQKTFDPQLIDLTFFKTVVFE